MKKTLLTIAIVGGLTAAATAQTLVVWGDNFDSDPGGSYGQLAWNFNSPNGNPQINIANDNPQGTNTQNLAMTFTSVAGQTLNFGLETAQLSATGNTNTDLSAYTLEFDMAVQGVSIPQIGGFIGPTVGLFGNGADLYYPPGGGGGSTNPPPTWFPAAGTGYQHYSIPLNEMTASAGDPLLTTTDSTFAFFIGFYMGSPTNNVDEEIDIANLQLVVNQTAPPPPRPLLTMIPAKPGLRVFAQDATETYNQEGFGTVDFNQSWVGATKHPVTYSVTFQDFNTANGYQFFTQMVGQYGGGVNPYIVYSNPNALVWTITAQSSGFTWSLDWKTNSPNAGQTNHVVSGTNTAPGGAGTWSMTFTSDTAGSITAPDGIPVPFTLPAGLPAQMANPMTIAFGEAAGTTNGYGQYFDISKIVISNVAGTNEIDDFTLDSSFNTNYWSAAFSVTSTNAVVEATTNTPYWVNWTSPALGYGLETKAKLTDSTWYLPTYWNGTPLVIPPTRMGTGLFWTLVPNTCLPTVGNVVGGTPSPTGYFQVQNPPTSQ